MIASRAAAWTDTAMMLTVTAVASPTVSTAASAAVRYGFLAMFSPASSTVTADRREDAAGAVMRRAAGPARSGAPARKATAAARAPAPASAVLWLPSIRTPAARSTMAAAAATAVTASRPRDRRTPGEAASRRARTGSVPAARRATRSVEATVTTVPVTTVITAVRGANTRPPAGSVPPSTAISPRRPAAARTPSPVPAAEAASPRIAASASAERSNWPRLAPMARSSAYSRARCAVRTENVPAMMNAATNSAAAQKASRYDRRLPRYPAAALSCWAAACAPVSTLAPGGSSGVMRSPSTASDRPERPGRRSR